jgi:hypothetical protein
LEKYQELTIRGWMINVYVRKSKLNIAKSLLLKKRNLKVIKPGIFPLDLIKKCPRIYNFSGGK